MTDNKAVMQQALDALMWNTFYLPNGHPTTLSSAAIAALIAAIAQPVPQIQLPKPDYPKSWGGLYSEKQMYEYAAACSQQSSTAMQPVQPNNLAAAVFDAWEHYERTGSVCRFEGRSMIYASTLEEIHETAIAQPVQPSTRVTRVHLTPEQQESLRCKTDVSIPGALGGLEAIAQPVQPTTHNFEMTASRIELLATMLHCVPHDEWELFKNLNTFCHDARTAFNKAAIAQPVPSPAIVKGEVK